MSVSWAAPTATLTRARWRLAGLTVLVLLASLSGCSFGGIIWRNLPIFVRTPAPPPRADRPVHDGAALAVLFIGHATVLVQLHDRFVLTDPVFTEFVGGFSRRLVAPGLAPQELPALSAVLVSHRHFDHLSRGSFPALEGRTPTVLVPPGAGHDVPPGSYRTEELPAWDTWESDGLRVTAVPVAHEGGRYLVDNKAHQRAFTGYVIEHRGVTVYFPGDTAYRQEVFTAVARRFPRIDLALLPIGPRTPTAMMRPSHLDPLQALQAAADLDAQQVVPIHFGTFQHSYDEPGALEALFDRAAARDARFRGRVQRLLIGERRVLLPGW